MNRHLSLFVLGAVLNLCLWPLSMAEALSINNRNIEPSRETTKTFIEALKRLQKVKPKGRLHGLATFSRNLSQEERRLLANKFGINVLEPYQNATYWVSVTKPTIPRNFGRLDLDVKLVPLVDQDRVHAKIFSQSYDEFIIPRSGEQSLNYVLQEGNLRLTVRFHLDVAENEAVAILAKYTQSMKKKSPVTWLIQLPQTALHSLVQEDSIQWIEAGPLPFLPENNNTRNAINVDNVQNISISGSYDADGSDVKVAIFDNGIDASHPDLGGRVTDDPLIPNVADPDNHHGTHVAGIVAGSGLQSTDPQSCDIGLNPTGIQSLWRGMAPAAGLIDKHKDDGDDIAVYDALITSPGMHLSNHSYMISHFDGEYGELDRMFDGMIRGISITKPRLAVFSAGNQGVVKKEHLFQKGYFSLTKQLKNGLVVGNLPATDDQFYSPAYGGVEDPVLKDQIWRGSSLGPTYDGRIKPDVVAPGGIIMSTFPPKICDSSSSPPCSPSCKADYGYDTGTSHSAAAVSGSIALLVQRYVASATELPIPSTLRATIIHTANDIESSPPPNAWFSNPDGAVWATKGPDFVTGWGRIDVQKAMSILEEEFWHEDSITGTCDSKTYAFSIDSTNPFRVTLAWDDFPASGQTDNSDPKLINDLDLVLTDPNGIKHYPWRLNQTIYDYNLGIPLSHPAFEKCVLPIKVRTDVTPTTSPASNNDPGLSLGFSPAVSGTDHLNNVERVDLASPAIGMWQAKVLGFKIREGPQTFSLIGAQFSEISVPTNTKCKVHGLICEELSKILVCRDKPWVCENKAIYKEPKRCPPICPPLGNVRVKFDSYKDKSIVPVNKLCGLAFDCPPCIKLKTCRRVFVRVDSVATGSLPLDIEVFTDQGQLLARSYSQWKDKQISVKENNLLVAVKPLSIASLGKDYEINIEISDHKISP